LRAVKRGILSVSLIAILLTLVLGVSTAAQSLPLSCGAIGAGAYHPTPVKMPKVVLTRGTVVTVTAETDDEDGDVSSVAALLKSPGSDGTISLREVIDAINHSPGTYTIQFAPSLKGATINVGSVVKDNLPALLAGNVTIRGDIDSDGKPDITINNFLTGSAVFPVGFQILSSFNTLYSLNIRGFMNGVMFNHPGSGLKFDGNTLARLNITGSAAGSGGINLDTGHGRP
jgi:hypothetical protein